VSPSFLTALCVAIPFTISKRKDWARLRVSLIYLWRHGYVPDLESPTRFNEWVQWRKLNDRDFGLAMLTDKLKTKILAGKALGEDVIIPTLWQGDELPELPAWPTPFIVKANHGCGQFVVVRTVEDWAAAQRRSPGWLKRSYGTWLDEWHYRAAQRTLFIEPFIGTGDELPLDYKVFVFGGVAQIIQVHLGRATDHQWVQFSRNWERLSSSNAVIEIPARLGDMLSAAERMAIGRDHLRVDFYEVRGKLWFGETCLFPGSGLDPFEPVELDEVFGRLWSEARDIHVKGSANCR
jgi:hypothetical protein